MLDGLLGRGFSAKCKSSIKLTKARIDVIRRKRNAMQKYLKKDVADLLANGLDINAYGRAEGLYIELNLSSCYDAVEQFCGCIPLHLSVMQKQRECPEECREAVSSLMFAAARFADLPEVRDLRDMFSERYGNSLESFVNREFVENLASKPPTVDMKLQLMREIAKEFSIKWDYKAFEQKISTSRVPVQELPKRKGSFLNPKVHGNKVETSNKDTALKRDNLDNPYQGRRVAEDGVTQKIGRVEAVSKRDKQDIVSHGRLDVTKDGYTPRIRMEENVLKGDDQSQGRWKSSENKYKPQKGREETSIEGDTYDVLVRQEYTGDRIKPHRGRNDTILKRDDPDSLSQGRKKHVDDDYKIRKGREDISNRRENQDLPSSTKQENSLVHTTKQKVNIDSSKDLPFSDYNHNGLPNRANAAETAGGAESLKPTYTNMIPPYIKPNGSKYSIRSTTADHATSDRSKPPTGPPIQDKDILNGRSDRPQRGAGGLDFERQVIGPARINSREDEDYHRHQDDLASEKKPKPRSVRRRHLKPPAGPDYAGNNEADEFMKQKPSGRKREDARRGLQLALDDDCHPRDDEERIMDKLLVHYSTKPSNIEPPQRRSRNRASSNPEPAPPPVRALSLPPEPAPPTDAGRLPVRAASFQQDVHVHPRLPDYDDLAARFAALKGR